MVDADAPPHGPQGSPKKDEDEEAGGKDAGVPNLCDLGELGSHVNTGTPL